VRELLAALEEGDAEPTIPLAYLAGTAVELAADDVRAAVRRAELLLATGGDPRRELDPDGRAVAALAGDLDAPAAREQLGVALALLARDAAGLPRVEGALDGLRADTERAWRAFACALLADALDDPG
jgi:hypothetical protein